MNAQKPDRHELQANGKHPAPCAKFCEATAFTIELRRAQAKIERLKEEITGLHEDAAGTSPVEPSQAQPEPVNVGLMELLEPAFTEIQHVLGSTLEVPYQRKSLETALELVRAAIAVIKQSQPDYEAMHKKGFQAFDCPVCGFDGALGFQPAAQPSQEWKPALSPATISTAPACLNTNDKAMWVLGWNECLNAQPPAPSDTAITYVTGYSDGREWAGATNQAQPSQADAQDAARYRWLAGHCRSTSEHWGGRWSIVVDGPAPKSHDSEDDLDAAIDAAMTEAAHGIKQGGQHD